MRSENSQWWSDAVIYQVYIRSFQDSSGDGVGDLQGVRDRINYLSLLGVDGLWITPFYPSPMADHGYDISDQRGIDPLFGDLATFDALIRDAHSLDLRIIIDLVPNHTSDQHPWFRQALSAPPGSPERALYHFHDGNGPDGSEPPNNWPSAFGGSAWTRVPDGQWYLHLFSAAQPDLNFDSPDVTLDVEKTLRFWLDRGVDGFRIDVAHGMAKARGLPNMANPSAKPMESVEGDLRFDADEVHDVHRMIRRVLDAYPDRMAVGETWLTDDERTARYARPDELHSVFNFRLLETPWNADQLANAIVRMQDPMVKVGAPPLWVLGVHDWSRPVARYGGGEVGLRRARAASLLQLALPGAAYIYYGDELGMPNVDLPDEALQDPMWERSGRTTRGRDAMRIPLPWTGEKPPYDFSTNPSTWLPMPEGWEHLTVEAQLENVDSTLSLYRTALELRREFPITPGDRVEWFGAPENCLAFQRAGGLNCALNTGESPVPLPPGKVILASGPLHGDQLPPDTAVWLA